MIGIANVLALYEAYLSDVERLKKKSPPTAGLFGIGNSTKNDLCHDKFVSDLGNLLSDIRSQEPTSEEIREILAFIYRAPLKYTQHKAAYWMMLAVHGLTANLADCLAPQDAAALHDIYTSDYRRWERLPSQEKILAVLERVSRS